MKAEDVLQSSLFELRKMKQRADRALAQVSREDLFRKLDPESNSIAEVMKHVGGNLRSRWTDFLHSDGEKAGRSRDSEFLQSETDTPESLHQKWENGWACVNETLQQLRPEDMERSVAIRGETHTVIEAIQRTLTHTSNHVGQIILLAKHYAGPRWQTLTVPRGQSDEYTAQLMENKGGSYLSKG